jgi:hypothetical protein
MPMCCVKMPVGVPIGLVTLFCMYQHIGICLWFIISSLDFLTRVSYTVSSGVGAHGGRVSITRPGDIVTGFRSIV